MSTTITKRQGVSVLPEPEFDDVVSYRSLDKWAIFSVCLALLSLAGLLFPGLLALALVGLVLGLIAIRNIRLYPEELTGLSTAYAGTMLSGVLLFGGSALHVFEYVNELPQGYGNESRITFAELQPDKQHPELLVSPKALELSGQKIFVKGYVHPEFSRGEVKKFVLVPDMGTCCFGGQPKLTDMIEVTLRDPHRIRYNQRIRKLAGVFKVSSEPKPVSGLGGVYYQLDAEYVQ